MSPLKSWHAYLRKCDNHLTCDNGHRGIMELTRQNLFPKQEDICTEKGSDGREAGDPSTGGCVAYVWAGHPARKRGGARNQGRRNVCAAGRSMGLTPTRRFRFRRGSLVEPGELGDTLFRYFASLGAESILACGLIVFVITAWLPWWVLSTTSTLTDRLDLHSLSTSSLLLPPFPALTSCVQPPHSP